MASSMKASESMLDRPMPDSEVGWINIATQTSNPPVFKYKDTQGIDISAENFEIIEKGYSRLVDRRLAEALYVKEYKEPELNRQKKSAKLLLFD